MDTLATSLKYVTLNTCIAYDNSYATKVDYSEIINT